MADIDEFYDIKSDDSLENEVISKVNSDIIKEALRELSDKDYEIMFLYLVKEHTPQEIAQLLDVSENLARQWVHRARQCLINLLEKRGITNDT